MGVLARARRGLGAMAVLLVFVAGIWVAAQRTQGGRLPRPPQQLAVIATLQGEGFFPAQLTIARGVPVRLFATSVDVVHALIIPEFRAEIRLRPGTVEVVEFTPARGGTFQIVCDYHPHMRATLRVLE